jgi:outer membrane protein assembly factor BamA
VHDQTSAGPVGPLQGQRYRFDVTQTAGSLNYTNLVLDYRRYLRVVRPFTLAVRGLHVGRYGGDAEDPRLSELFIGYPSLVRGYDVNSFDATECDAVTGACPVFDRLIGSRMLVGSAELRFPLLGAFSGEYRYGPIPIEGFLFADTGVAWTAATRPSFADGDRRFVSSVGAGVRINAFGYVIVQLAGAKPLNRPGSGWRFVFDFAPSF